MNCFVVIIVMVMFWEKALKTEIIFCWPLTELFSRLLFCSYCEPKRKVKTYIIKSLYTPSWCIFMFPSLQWKSHRIWVQELVFHSQLWFQKTKCVRGQSNYKSIKLFPFFFPSFFFGGGDGNHHTVGPTLLVEMRLRKRSWWENWYLPWCSFFLF